MTAGAALGASLLATLGRPAWWVLALAAFLARGGFVLFLLPIVDLPSPLALANELGPIIFPLALGRLTMEAVTLIGLVVGGLILWLIVGGLLAGSAEGSLAREAAAEAVEDGIGGPRSPAAGGVRRRAVGARILAARLAAAVPLAIALGIGSIGIVAATYAEVTRPDDVTAPLAIRVAGRASGQIAAIILAWAFGEIIGGAAARRIAIDGTGAAPAVWRATRDLLTRPGSIVVPWLLVTLAMVVVATTFLAASGAAWHGLRVAVLTPTTGPAVVLVALLAFVAIWLGGLVTAGLLAASRGSVGAYEHVRVGWREPAGRPGEPSSRREPGTFGASAHHRPGDWSGDDRGGSL